MNHVSFSRIKALSCSRSRCLVYNSTDPCQEINGWVCNNIWQHYRVSTKANHLSMPDLYRWHRFYWRSHQRVTYIAVIIPVNFTTLSARGITC